MKSIKFKKFIYIFLATLVMLPYQNCTSFDPTKGETPFKRYGGDGIGFPGIDGKVFYSYIEDYMCPSNKKPLLENVSKVVTVPKDPSLKVEVLDTCSGAAENLDLKQLFYSDVDQEHIGLDNWIAEYKEVPPATDQEIHFLCQSQETTGVLRESVMTGKHRADGFYSARIRYPERPDNKPEAMSMEVKPSEDKQFMIYSRTDDERGSLTVSVEKLAGSYLHEAHYDGFFEQKRVTAKFLCVVTVY